MMTLRNKGVIKCDEQLFDKFDMNGKEYIGNKIKSNRTLRLFIGALLACCGLYGLAMCLQTNRVVDKHNRLINADSTKVLKNVDLTFLDDLFSSRNSSAMLNNMSKIKLKRDILLANQINIENTIYVIKYDFDLNGGKVTLPLGCVLKFDGGRIRNGILIGNHTRIIAQKKAIFDSVSIEGTWDVPEVTSDWFVCEKDNDLVQAFNLLSDEIPNTITVENRDKDYWVDCQTGGSFLNPVGILNIKSNTKCILNGTIRQRGHHSNHIHLILLDSVENVVLEGSGTIHGEKVLHDYTNVVPILPSDEDYKKNTQENNHIINVLKSKNVHINGLTLKDATGDGIDVLNYDKIVDNHIVIENFTIDNCGRQGISAEGVNIEIKHGVINKVDRTMPMSGVDIEISKNRTGDLEACNIKVSDVRITNCYTGFQSYTPNDNPAYIHDLTFENVNCSNVNRGFCIAEPIKNVSLVSCSFDIIPSLGTLTLNYSPSDNFTAESCSFICNKKKCREKWGWPNIRPDDQGYSDKNTKDYDFTMLRTGARIAKYKKNSSHFRKCVFYSPYTNLIKRANNKTIIEDCDITSLKLNVVTASVDDIIRNSKVKITSAN